MGLLSRLFGENEIRLIEKADSLVGTAGTLAVTSFTKTGKRFPSVATVDPKRWDFALTVAGVFVAVSQLNHETLSAKTTEAILDRVYTKLGAWDPRGPDAHEDCRAFVDRTYDGLKTLPEYCSSPQFLFSDSLGSWVVWNLLDHTPTSSEEGRLARTLGGLLVHSFINWWKPSKLV